MQTRTACARLLLAAALAAAQAAGCGSESSTANDASNVSPDAGSNLSPDAASCTSAAYTENVSACVPAATDYQPRKMTPGANGWPTCVSDSNTWHFMPGANMPSSTARSMAFDTMSGKLWDNPVPPSKDNFLSARDDYSVAQGIASRVARRQDIHYPPVPGDDKFACNNAGVPAQYPDRCAGPAKLQPIIEDAFQKGIEQNQPLVQATRIEAALIWFFYLSTSSEVWTCSFDNINDCDSAAGYYTQVSAREAPAGLARYVAALGPETHNRIYDGLLAERCWRDIDKAMPATEQYMNFYNLAQDQINKAALRGVALMLRQRIGKILCLSGEAQQAQIEFVKILGGLLDHGAALIDSANAAKLKAFTANPTADAGAVAAAQAAIDTIFVCP